MENNFLKIKINKLKILNRIILDSGSIIDILKCEFFFARKVHPLPTLPTGDDDALVEVNQLTLT